MGFFATFWSWLNGQLAAYIGDNTARLASALEPAVVTVATIYVMAWGYLHLMGKITEPFEAGLKRVALIALILGVGLRLWLYNTVIVDTFYNAPAQLAAAVVGASDPVGTIDAIWDSGGTVAGNLWDKGGVLSGDVQDVVLLDVTPLSLGVETLGGVMTVMIPRNTTLPTQKIETFSTASDDQPGVEVHVLQGERSEAKSNRTLGRFTLAGIMPAPRGVPKVEVSFDIDANGILSVRAKDTATGKDQKITVTASSGLSEAEIQKMVKDAAEHEADDRVRREQVERRNKLDNLCYAVGKTLAENKDKLQAADASQLEALVQEAKSALEHQDDGVIASVTERLEKEASRIASALRDGDGPPANGSAPGSSVGGNPGRKDVVDAEFEDASHHP